MNNFYFRFLTHIFFDRGEEKKVGELTAQYGKHVLILYGSERIQENGLLPEIIRRIKKELIQEIVYSEDRKKPYSDQEISKKLEDYQIKISRRTVNKYRIEMGLPDKSGRKI